MTKPYIHLHVHSEYSLVDGILRLDELIDYCVAHKIPAIALTDRVNIFGAVKFYQEAIQNGIKPILGAELLIENKSNIKKPYSLIVLCQNQVGYNNLTKLLSRSYLENQIEEKLPLIKKEWFHDYNEGLLALSGEMEGDIGQAIVAEQYDEAERLLSFWLNLFNDRFYLEIARLGRENEEEFIEKSVELAQKHQICLVATNKAVFKEITDFEAHETRVCIHEGYTLDDPKRPKRYSNKQYLTSPKEMTKLFSDLPEAVINSYQIALRCNVHLSLGKVFLPSFPVPSSITIEQFLEEKANIGLQKRLEQIAKIQNTAIENINQIYQDRLDLELSVIQKMGFAGYFLIVADFIEWAKHNGVPVGPGRGSGAGSLVAFALEITGLDPLAYDLLFERFLNPERISMPDFDIDFCMDGRDRVIEYVNQHYGSEKVSQIITFGTMAAKAVVRDVGRALGYPYGFVDKIAKLIPFELGITLDKALEQEQVLKDRYENEDEVKTLIDLAKKLEGLTRNAGKHAGGVVIAPTEITDFVPIFAEPEGKHPVTQFDKDDVEAIGLVKFDFLGLRTLTIIAWAVETINNKRKAENLSLIDIETIPLNDSKSFDLLKNCETTGVFQLESRGMKDLIKRLQPDCFEDIVALVALFRPGPLQSGMVDDFILRKHGQAEILYSHPALEPILKPTYGVILYQEQVMQIAQVLAGYTLGSADLLRRAMGKKKPEEMAKQRAIFVSGAKDKEIPNDISGSIFDLMEKFAGYGFNKSHSAAYALISYQTAWLKANYPAAFMAAVLSSDMDNTDKVANFVDECKRMGLNILPPDIQESEFKFTAVSDNSIRYGLGALKGVGEAAVELIIQERYKGAFASLKDFCVRMDLRKINKRVLEALIKSGSLCCFDSSRTELLTQLEKAIQAAEQTLKNRNSGQIDLFSDESHDEAEININSLKETPLQDLLRFEKETFGFYFSRHPLSPYQAELNHIIDCKINEIAANSNQTIKICGHVVACRTLLNKRGDKFAFLTVEDWTGRLELAAFSDVYKDFSHFLTSDQNLVLEIQISTDDQGQTRYNLKKAWDIVSARQQFAHQLNIVIKESQISMTELEIFVSLIKLNKGPFPVHLLYQNNLCSAQFLLSKKFSIAPTDDLINEISKLEGLDFNFIYND